MGDPLVIGVIALALLAGASQIAIPWIAEKRIGRRLTEGGGQAMVAIAATPAIRLLRHEGDRIVVRGREVVIGLSSDSGSGLSALDGFSEVDVTLSDFTTGPFEVFGFELTRAGEGPYAMRSHATTSGADLLAFGGRELGIVGAPLLGLIARSAPLGGRSFPVTVEVELESIDGRLRISSGGGTIAGYPAGPIASILAAAVARRLELTP